MPSNLTDTQSAEYDQALAALLAQVSQHPAVLAFQAAEERLKAVLYKKIDKVKAYQETMARSKIIEAQLNESPLIMDYRRKLVVANDLLQHLLQTLESQINEELYRDK